MGLGPQRLGNWNSIGNGWYTHNIDPRRLRHFTANPPSPEAYEIYEVDGTVYRLESQGGNQFLAVWKRDAFDNQTTYEWVTVNGQVRPYRVTYPNGLQEQHTYTDPTGQTYHDCVISYPNYQGPSGVVADDLKWGYRMESDGRLLHVWNPKRKVITGCNGPGTVPIVEGDCPSPIYSLNESDLYYVTQYVWSTTPEGDRLVTQMREYHLTSTVPPDPSLNQGTVVTAFVYSKNHTNTLPGYVAANDLYRVVQQTDRWGNVDSFSYELGDRVVGGPPEYPGFTHYKYYVTKMTHDAPNGTKTVYNRDELGRVLQLSITPSDTASGLPRKYESSDNPTMPEPTSVAWTMEYNGGSCTCMHPTKVTEQPSGRVWEYTWDQSRSLLLSETVHDPAAPSSGAGSDAKVTYTYQYETGWETTPPRFSLLKKVINPDGSTLEYDHAYDTQATRIDPNHGSKLLSLTSKSELIGSTFRITETSHFDSLGRVYKHIDPEGTDTRRFFDATQWGQYFVHREIVGYQQGATATETKFEFDDLGRLCQRWSDSGATAETHTTWSNCPANHTRRHRLPSVARGRRPQRLG